MTIVYSCLYFVSISRGFMTKPIGFLRVRPLSVFLLVCYLINFFQYIFVYDFIYLQSNCNNGYLSRTNFVNFLKINIFLSYLKKRQMLEKESENNKNFFKVLDSGVPEIFVPIGEYLFCNVNNFLILCSLRLAD